MTRSKILIASSAMAMALTMATPAYAQACTAGVDGSDLQCGTGAVANGPFATAVGNNSTATGNYSSAFGNYAMAIGYGATAVGTGSTAGVFGTTTGYFADAGYGATANGTVSQALGDYSTAIGTYATTNGIDSTALGFNANDGGFANTVALGANTTATADNQVYVGGRTIGGVTDGVLADDAATVGQVAAANAAETAARIAADNGLQSQITAQDVTNATQDGQITALQTSDTSQNTAITAIQAVNTTQTGQITALQTSDTSQNTAITAIQAVNTTQTSQITALQTSDATQNGRLTALESVAFDFDGRLDDVEDRASAGSAVAIALGGNSFLPGKSFNLTGNVGSYRGAVAGALQFGAMVSDSAAFNAGVAKGFNKDGKVGARVGFTFGW